MVTPRELDVVGLSTRTIAQLRKLEPRDPACDAARLAQKLGHAPNGTLERDEVDLFIRESRQQNGDPITEGKGYVHNRARMIRLSISSATPALPGSRAIEAKVSSSRRSASSPSGWWYTPACSSIRSR